MILFYRVRILPICFPFFLVVLSFRTHPAVLQSLSADIIDSGSAAPGPAALADRASETINEYLSCISNQHLFSVLSEVPSEFTDTSAATESESEPDYEAQLDPENPVCDGP